MAETLKLQAPSVGQWAPAVALAWLIPGGGHFLLKRPGRGAVLSISVILVFLLGLMMRGTLFQPQLIHEVVDNQGIVVKPFQPKVLRQLPISQPTMQLIQQSLFVRHQVCADVVSPNARHDGIELRQAALFQVRRA